MGAVDSAGAAVGLTERQERALAGMPSGVYVDWNPVLGTPRTVIRRGQYLTGPADDAPVDAARKWLRQHAGLYDWTLDQVGELRLAKELHQPDEGPTILLFHQRFGELEGGSFVGSLSVSLDRQKRLLGVRSNVLRRTDLEGSFAIGAGDALAVVSGVQAPPLATGEVAGWTSFSGAKYARRIAFASLSGRGRMAWEVFFTERLDSVWRAVVDGQSGEVLSREQVVAHSEAPPARVFRNHPGAPRGGVHEIVPMGGDAHASPSGWTFGPTTAGNNASTATNWGDDLVPEPSGELRPVGTFDHPFTDGWAKSDCGKNPVHGLGFYGPDLPTYVPDALPAVVNLFYHHNVMHDYWHGLGFDEPAGAMQIDNFGHGGEGGDPLLGLAQAGAPREQAHTYSVPRNNGYMAAMPDGIPSWSAMFLQEPDPGFFVQPCVDGDFDAAFIYHEYSHAVTSRWVGAEYGNLSTSQGRSMGEGWGDFFALHYLFENNLEEHPAFPIYATGNSSRGFRNWALDKTPVGFGDLGYDIIPTNPHADGEIWSATLWDMRTRLGAHVRGGTQLAAQLVADGMPLAGPNPSMLDARDAILSAELARSGGLHQDLLWDVFARHGMGITATTVDANDVNPIPSFAHFDPARNGTVRGRLTTAGSKKVPIAGANVFVGTFEANTTPVARTAADGSFSFRAAAGTYPLAFQAPGYGTQTSELRVKADATRSVTYRLSPNLASSAAGSAVSAVSNPSTLGAPEKALSDTEGDRWITDPDVDGPNGEWFVVELPGEAALSVASLQVSAYPDLDIWEAVQDFSVHSSMDGTNFVEIARGSFLPHPSPNRPYSADLHYKRITLKTPVQARYLKLVAERPHYTANGGLTAVGEPFGTARGVQVAELQAFGTSAVFIETAPLSPLPPVHDEGQVLLASAVAGTVLGGPTEQTMRLDCRFPPSTQGTDAWVTELPDSYSVGGGHLNVRATPLAVDPSPDVAIVFLNEGCQFISAIDTNTEPGDPDESGPIPAGTKYVLSLLWAGAPSLISLDAGPAL